MPSLLHAHFLPELVDPQELSGSWVIVIDVLRASTTIVYALAAGASQVIPCLEIDDARRAAARFPADEVLLGGERGGLPIAGFHHGNSPEEYAASAVRGKTVVFTTTNGTKAMIRCRHAQRVLIGAAVNRQAICEHVEEADQPVHLLCAGTDGRISREDVLVAGGIIERLAGGSASPSGLNDEAAIARAVWREAVGDQGQDEPKQTGWLQTALGQSRGGQNLVELGLQRDIATAAQLDRFAMVPELDLAAWSIRACGRA